MKVRHSVILFLSLFFTCLILCPVTVFGEVNGPAVTKLDSHSMRPNNKVTGVHIGETVKEIAADTFRNQINLTYIEVSNDNPLFTSYTYCLYDKDMTTLICFPQALKKAEIPSTVTKINQYALYGVLPEIQTAVKQAVIENAARAGVEPEYVAPTVFPYDYVWPYTCVYPLTN